MNIRALHFLSLAVLLSVGSYGQAGITFQFSDVRTCTFAGDAITAPVVLLADQDFEGSALWRLSLDRHTVSSREQAVNLNRNAPLTFSLAMQLPEEREGIVLECRLLLSLTDRQGNEHGTVQKPLNIFPRDPFALKREWLTRLDLCVFDPLGKTTAAFDALAIPYRQIDNLSALEPSGAGVLIIGEGLSLEENRGLFATVSQVAASGTPVLFLAPSDGEFMIPGTADLPEEPFPAGVSFRDHDVIASFDKRYDTRTWTGDLDTIVSHFQLTGLRSQAILQVSANHGWPWLELSWPGDGKLLVCGFGVIRDWEASPVPRYLLAGILEYFSKRKP